MKTKITLDATGLTQLSSREQLSALMDGALPPDETRFLLRRLQHDASLAECWERWRLSAEVMRGLAPAQRLPVDFASRVAASLRDEEEDSEQRAGTVATGRSAVRTSSWLRWGGGAAVAASLAVVALMNQPSGVGAPGERPDNAALAVADLPKSVANDSTETLRMPIPEKGVSQAVSQTPLEETPLEDRSGMGLESQSAALATAIAAAARPLRNGRRESQARTTQVASVQAAPMQASMNAMQSVDAGLAAGRNIKPFLPQADIITRPWPRSVLSHGGNSGLTVGFGNISGDVAPYNPFQPRTGIANMPPAFIVDPPATDVTAPASDETDRAANSEPQS